MVQDEILLFKKSPFLMITAIGRLIYFYIIIKTGKHGKTSLSIPAAVMFNSMRGALQSLTDGIMIHKHFLQL